MLRVCTELIEVANGFKFLIKKYSDLFELCVSAVK